jgi:tRNA (guanine-N7-)-methyltransferase
MSDAQKKAYSDLSSQWVIESESGPLEWEALFGTHSRRVVEIGFGMGDATKGVALEHPDWAILGVEVHRPGIGKLLWLIEQNRLSNVRIVEGDAVDLLQDFFSPESVGAFHVWFPDPWPKKKHHKRRLMQAPTVDLLVKALKTGGYIHFATDWEPYADEVLALLEAVQGLENRFSPWAPGSDCRPPTKFEKRGIAARRVIRDLIFVKKH